MEDNGVVSTLAALARPMRLRVLRKLVVAGLQGLTPGATLSFDDQGLGDLRWTDEQLIDFMRQHPILINRPIVVTPLGTRLYRPSELVLEILPAPQTGAFTKEDGERVVDDKGQRVHSP